MLFLVVLLSYLLGLTSTIVFLIYLYKRLGFSPAVASFDHEQYECFHPLSEEFYGKNSTIDTVNYLVHLLFQESRDTSAFRRYVIRKLNEELNDLKQKPWFRLFIRSITIQSFSMGRQCPTLTDIRLERQERLENGLIKQLVTRFHGDYRDGFSVDLDIRLLFGYQCQLSIKVRHIHGDLRLEFRHEPYSHWVFVFEKEPSIDLNIQTSLFNRKSSLLSQIIKQEISRTIKRKQTWPSYKIRYRPFFMKSQQSLPRYTPSADRPRGVFNIIVENCDRLAIPLRIFPEEKRPLLSIFLTLNIDERMPDELLRIRRERWPRKEIELIPQRHEIIVKEVIHIDRTEFLIEKFDPLPESIEDPIRFQSALKDRSVFLLAIEHQEIRTLTQVNLLLRSPPPGATKETIRISIALAFVTSTRIPLSVPTENLTSVTTTFEPPDLPEVEQAAGAMTVLMMNEEILAETDFFLTPTRTAERNIECNDRLKFEMDGYEQYLNVCLWCKPPVDLDTPQFEKKIFLLGYTSTLLSEIALDAQMSFQRETQVTLNFRSPLPRKTILMNHLANTESQEHLELSRHKNYDVNLTNGFVTMNIHFVPNSDNAAQEGEETELSHVEQSSETHDQHGQRKDSDEVPMFKSHHHHRFEDRTFHESVHCHFCTNRIWFKTTRQCRYCSIIVHSKCEQQCYQTQFCPRQRMSHEPMPKLDGSFEIIDNVDPSPSRASYPLVNNFDGKVRRRFRSTKSSTSSGTSKTDRIRQSSSKISSATSSAYNKLREFKSKRRTIPSMFDRKKNSAAHDSRLFENIPEADLQAILTSCLTEEVDENKNLQYVLHEKAVDGTVLYAKSNELAHSLFDELTIEKRKEKFENEISRLQQEIDLQGQIRDELIVEYNSEKTDEHEKSKIQQKMINIDEKIQALGALTIFYCSGYQHCCAQIDMKNETSVIDE